MLRNFDLKNKKFEFILQTFVKNHDLAQWILWSEQPPVWILVEGHNPCKCFFCNSTRNSPAGQGRAEGKGIFNCLKSPISVRSTSTQKQFRSFSGAQAPRVGLTG